MGAAHLAEWEPLILPNGSRSCCRMGVAQLAEWEPYDLYVDLELMFPGLRSVRWVHFLFLFAKSEEVTSRVLRDTQKTLHGPEKSTS